MGIDPTSKRDLPRLVDMIGPDEPKRMSRRRRIAADARSLAFGEPIPLDRSAITYRPRPVSGPLAEDGKPSPLVQGETFPIAN